MSEKRTIRIRLGGRRPPAGCPVGRHFVTDSYTNEAIHTKLSVARTSLFTRFPFWGHLAMSIPFIEDPTGFTKTMSTCGRNIYYSVEFCEKYPAIQLATVVAHELDHNLSHHVGMKSRRGDRHPKRWNYAGDFTINADLIEMKMEMPEGFPYCYDEKYKGWSTEAIYDDLKFRKNENPGDQEGIGGEGMGGEGDEGDPSDEDKYDLLDDHLEIDEEDLEQIEAELGKEWTEHLIRADSARRMAEEAGMGSSAVPNSIRRMIDKMHEPKKNWRDLLRRFVSSTIRRGYSYASPHKGAFQSGISLPGFRRRVDEYDMAFAIDTSASIGEDALAKAISEVLGVCSQLPAFRIAMWTFDTSVHEHSYTVITNRGGKAGVELIRPFLHVMEGGGGTLFRSNWEFMRKKRIRPKVFCMGTDGDPNGGDWGEPDYCPTLFLIIGPERHAPFGTTVQYE